MRVTGRQSWMKVLTRWFSAWQRIAITFGNGHTFSKPFFEFGAGSLLLTASLQYDPSKLFQTEGTLQGKSHIRDKSPTNSWLPWSQETKAARLKQFKGPDW